VVKVKVKLISSDVARGAWWGRSLHRTSLAIIVAGQSTTEQFHPSSIFVSFHTNQLSNMSTAKRSPPFRAEHVGSLLRPDELVQKRYAVAAGKADAGELKPIEDKSVTEVVKLQKDCGFHAVSSGEYTRYVFLFLCVFEAFAFPRFNLHHNPPMRIINTNPKNPNTQKSNAGVHIKEDIVELEF
jgi:hypothetical protein